jgi:hypothetical protein
MSDPRAAFADGLFEGRTAVVTGGGRGIGRAIAVGFARLGANVVIASNAPAELDDAAVEIEALGAECLKVEVNIRDVDSVDAFRDATIERFGAVDYLVNNAGGQFQAHPLDISDNGWRAVIDLNLNGTWNVCSRFMRHMMERRTGSIVNVAHVFSFERGARRGRQPHTQPGPVPRAARRDDQRARPGDDDLSGGGGELRDDGRRVARAAEPSPLRRSRGHGGDRAVHVLPRGADAQRRRDRRRRRLDPVQLAGAVD